MQFASYGIITAPNYGVAYFWSLGFATYHWATLGQFIFIMALAERWNELWSKRHIEWVFIPAAIITVLYLISLVFFPSLEFVDGRWNASQSSSMFMLVGDSLMGIWSVLLYIYLIIVTRKYYKNTFDPIKRIQIKYLLWASIVSVAFDIYQTIGWFTPIQTTVLPISSMTLFVGIMAIAIAKYDFLAINASNAAESIVATMSDAVFLLSKDYRVHFVNSTALKMIGAVRDSVIGKPIDSFINAGNNSLLSKRLRSQLRSRKSFSDIEGAIRHQIEDEDIPVSISAAYITNSDNSITRGIVCIVRDISDRKLQQERLESSYKSIKLADKQIRVEIAKLRSTLAAIGEGLVLVDEQGKIVMANPTATALLGWRDPDIIGKDFANNFRVTDEKGIEFPFAEKVLAAQHKGISLRYTMSDYLYVASRSKRIPISMTASPVKSGTSLIGSIVIFENITREMEIDKAKSEFVSLAAHQLRTPISAIMWNLEIIEPEIKDKVEKEIYELAITAYRQANNMSGLVNQFLNVSRIELGKLSVKPENLDVVQILEDVLSEQQMVAKEKKQKLAVKTDKGIPEIPLDKVLIRIVLQNLISNAIKYTPEKGNVTISMRKDTTYAVFTVKDTGIGIPEDQQKNLFSKLFRAKNAVESGLEGNGLGLYIVKSIVRLMKGEISFVSEVNKGTTFTVTIPYKGMEKKEGTRGLVEVNG